MKFLKCVICEGELDIVGNYSGVSKIVKCRNCGYSNLIVKKDVEVIVKRKIDDQ